MRKKVKKKVPVSSRRTRTQATHVTRYIFIGFSVLILVFCVKLVTRPLDKPFVLGTSVLADNVENSISANSNTEIKDSTDIQSEVTNANPTPSINPLPQTHEGLNTEHPETIYVDCVGPDGKHFPTNLLACSTLNHSFHNDHFLFTVLKPNTTNAATLPTFGKPEHTDSSNSAGLRMPQNQNGGKGKLSIFQVDLKKQLENKDIQIEFNSQNGTTSAKIKMADGTEKELDENQTLSEINQQLSKIGIDISKTGSNSFSIKRNNVEAKTNLSVSVNPDTKELTITTPAGVKTIKVLPDEAIQRAFLTGKINSSENVSQTASVSGQIATDTTTLTTLNNEPVFKVNGFSNKKALGFIPVSFAKSIFVSATDGKIVKTDETLVSKILESISF